MLNKKKLTLVHVIYIQHNQQDARHFEPLGWISPQLKLPTMKTCRENVAYSCIS